MTAERETLELDVLFVGAGPASLAGAIHLARLVAAHNAANPSGRLELATAVLEKGAEIGAHALSGAIVDPHAFRELWPDRFDEIPFEAAVGREHVWWLTERRALPLPEPPPLRNHGNHVASLGRLVRWMAKEAEALGVDVFYEFAGREILLEEGSVVGVRTGDRGVGRDGRPKANFEPGVDVRAQITVLGEGPRGTLSKQLERRLDLTAGRNPQVYAIGIKEVWELPPGRFAPGEIWHSMGWPLWPDHFGGGFLYGMQDDLLVVGLVYGLDYENPWSDPHLEFQRLKTHPELRKLLEGGRMAYYGAKAIPEGGYWAMPRLGGDGFCLIGDSGGFVDGMKLKGIHLAMKSGMLAAETIFDALRKGETSAASLASYEDRVRESWAGDELWEVRNFHQAFDHGTLAGMTQAGIGMLTHGRGFGVFNRLRAQPGHTKMQRLNSSFDGHFERPRPVATDGALTFDKLADVYNSATAHEEDQPVHLLVHDTDVCIYQCAVEYANPCQRFCPANVYEMVADGSSPTGQRLQINASNCVHCKTCDIMDPYQIITWVPPEGGGGPNYGKM
jgi:electron-transferring-flavoprotein dehydrogenase